MLKLIRVAGIGLALFLAASAASASPRSGALVATGKSTFGQILVNAHGRTLYLFEKDKNGKSACSGACASFWPPLLTTGKPAAGKGVSTSLLGTTRRADGHTQVTYNGHPLYTFKLDTNAGQTKGQNSKAFGAEWYVLSPKGAKIEKASRAGGGGYNG